MPPRHAARERMVDGLRADSGPPDPGPAGDAGGLVMALLEAVAIVAALVAIEFGVVFLIGLWIHIRG